MTPFLILSMLMKKAPRLGVPTYVLLIMNERIMYLSLSINDTSASTLIVRPGPSLYRHENHTVEILSSAALETSSSS
jgi:hypothetical protein